MLQCEACAYTTTSDQMLRKHRSKVHPHLKKSAGRPPKETKKSRKSINKDYYHRQKTWRRQLLHTAFNKLHRNLLAGRALRTAMMD